MTRRLLAAPAAIALVVCSCLRGAVDGSFRADGGPAGPWETAPNRCTSGDRRAFTGVDLYRDADGDDAEIVPQIEGGVVRVLVRVPGRGTMVALTAADCARFDVRVEPNGVEVNEVSGITGSVSIDCTRPEVGHVEGNATFTCY